MVYTSVSHSFHDLDSPNTLITLRSGVNAQGTCIIHSNLLEVGNCWKQQLMSSIHPICSPSRGSTQVMIAFLSWKLFITRTVSKLEMNKRQYVGEDGRNSCVGRASRYRSCCQPASLTLWVSLLGSNQSLIIEAQIGVGAGDKAHGNVSFSRWRRHLETHSCRQTLPN